MTLFPHFFFQLSHQNSGMQGRRRGALSWRILSSWGWVQARRRSLHLQWSLRNFFASILTEIFHFFTMLLRGHSNNTWHYRGEGRLAKVSPNITWGGGGISKNVTWQFLLVISLVKVDKNLCHVTQGGRGRRNVTKCHIGGGGGGV